MIGEVMFTFQRRSSRSALLSPALVFVQSLALAKQADPSGFSQFCDRETIQNQFCFCNRA